MKKNLKIFCAMLLTLVVIFAANAQPAAAANIKIYLNGSQLSIPIAPRVENGTTLVPMRVIFESLGVNVNYDNRTKQITAAKDGTNISLVINSKNAYVNGVNRKLAVPAKAINGTTLVPLRFVSESLGAVVNWNGSNQSITITYNRYSAQTPIDKTDTTSKNDNKGSVNINKPIDTDNTGSTSNTSKPSSGPVYLMKACPPYDTDYGYYSVNGETIDGTNTFSMAGKMYSNGFKVGFCSEDVGTVVLFNLDGKYSSLEFDLGASGTTGVSEYFPLLLKIYLDGNVSEIIKMSGDEMPRHIKVPLNNARQMKIEAVSAEGHGFWGSEYGIANAILH